MKRFFLLLGVFLMACAGEKSAQKPTPASSRNAAVKTRSVAKGLGAASKGMDSEQEAYLRNYERGFEAWQKEDFGAAEKIFSQMVERFPKKAFPLYARGVCGFRKGNPDEAKRYFSRAVALKPNFSLAWAGIAQSERLLGHMGDSERAYVAALRFDPKDWRSHYNLGVLYETYLSQPEKALKSYREYLKWAPSDDPRKEKVLFWTTKENH